MASNRSNTAAALPKTLDEAGELPKRFNAVKDFPDRSDAIDEPPKGFYVSQELSRRLDFKEVQCSERASRSIHHS